MRWRVLAANYRWIKFGWNLTFMPVIFYRHLGIHIMTWHRAVMWKYIVICKTGSTKRIATTTKADGSGPQETWTKFCGFRVMWVYRQTDKQTYASQHLAAVPRATQLKLYSLGLVLLDSYRWVAGTRSAGGRRCRRAGLARWWWCGWRCPER